MKYISQIAFHKGIRNEEPNKLLAQIIVNTENKDAIKEISSFLKDTNKSIASDCIAVLYHVGYEKPELISELYSEFLSFLNSKNNRMVWGAMIAISTIAKVQPKKVYKDKDLILSYIEKGTVITQVWGVYTLVNLCNVEEYRNTLLHSLLEILDQTRDIDFAKRSEAIKPIISTEYEGKFNAILEKHISSLSKSAQNKVHKLLK